MGVGESGQATGGCLLRLEGLKDLCDGYVKKRHTCCV